MVTSKSEETHRPISTCKPYFYKRIYSETSNVFLKEHTSKTF